MINGSNTPEEERDLAQTPRFVYDWASREFGPFSIDLAANEQNKLCNMWYGYRDDMFINSLDNPWHNPVGEAGYICHTMPYPQPHRAGFNRKGWVNPPYSAIDAWALKAVMEAKQGFSTTMLIPTFNGDARDSFILDNATEVVYIIGRLSFISPSGRPMKGNPRGSMLVHFSAGLRPPVRFDYVKRDEMCQ